MQKQEQQYFLEATQNGVVRFDKNTDQQCRGLYTEKIQTCWAIIIFNKTAQRASLLHRTFKMNPKSILCELNWVAQHAWQAMAWSIVYNDRASFTQHLESDLKALFFIIKKALPACANPKLQSARGFPSINVCFDRASFAIETNVEKIIVQKSFHADERYFMNVVNDWFLTQAPNDLLDADIQFDGQRWTAMPSFKHDFTTLNIEYCKDFYTMGLGQVGNDFMVNLIGCKGNIYYNNKEYLKAVECYSRAVNVWPHFIKGWYNLGAALEKLGQIDKACQAWAYCIFLDFTHEKANKKLIEHQAMLPSTFFRSSMMQAALAQETKNEEKKSLGVNLAKRG